MKVAAYAISKNEERNLPNFLETVVGFDEVVVLDTGSSDKTVEKLREAGVKVFEHSFEAFDFSEARNRSLGKVSEDMHWCFSVDFNERIDKDWRGKLERLVKENPNVTAVEIVRYDDFNGDVRKGSEDKLILHRREMYAWENAVHEVLVACDGVKEQRVRSDISITKKIQRTKEKEDFYAAICLREYQKDPKRDFYLWFILGYYYEREEWQRVLEYGARYLDATASVKSDFRIHAHIRMSRAFYELGQKEQSFRQGMAGFSEAIFFPSSEPVFGQAVHHMIRYALAADNPELLVFMTGFVRELPSELSEARHTALRKLLLVS